MDTRIQRWAPQHQILCVAQASFNHTKWRLLRSQEGWNSGKLAWIWLSNQKPVQRYVFRTTPKLPVQGEITFNFKNLHFPLLSQCKLFLAAVLLHSEQKANVPYPAYHSNEKTTFSRSKLTTPKARVIILKKPPPWPKWIKSLALKESHSTQSRMN